MLNAWPKDYDSYILTISCNGDTDVLNIVVNISPGGFIWAGIRN
jgi:hypothetical protein